MGERLTGKPVAKAVYDTIKAGLAQYEATAKLVIVFIGDDPSAQFYVRNLEKRGAKVGIEVETRHCEPSISHHQLLKMIQTLNNDSTVHGIMLQKPLPSQINEEEIVLTISPDKDMDGFHPLNMGRLVLDQDAFLPSTPAAVIEMLRHYQIEVAGKHVVVLGRSAVVGKPLANLLLRKADVGNATVTVCHSRTRDLSDVTRSADILVAAIGQPRFVTAAMIKPEAVVIDVGVNQVEDEGKTIYVGDVDYAGCETLASRITPVPGGVGTVTTALLLHNVYRAFKKSRGLA